MAKEDVVRIARKILLKQMNREQVIVELKLGLLKGEKKLLETKSFPRGIEFCVIVRYRPAGCKDLTHNNPKGKNLRRVFQKAIKVIAHDVRIYRNSINKNGVFFEVLAKFNGREVEVDRRYWRDILKELNWKKTVFGN